MPRQGRIFIENACYHIITRANQERTVFREEDDFKYYLRLISKYKIEHGCLIYAYCLMSNHVHFVLEFPLGLKSMISFMHRLNQSYAMKFNLKYSQTGHLWQNRYKSYVVMKDDYLFNLISYIEFNPLRAKIVSKPEDYPWSSYRSRVLGENNIILDRFGIGDRGLEIEAGTEFLR